MASTEEKSDTEEKASARQGTVQDEAPFAPEERFHLYPAAKSALLAGSELELRNPYYCEENVWRLAYRRMYNDAVQKSEVNNQRSDYFAMFVSNPKNCVCFLQQRAGKSAMEPCFWDYHVILLQVTSSPGSGEDTNKNVLVWDMDSHLPFPCPIKEYFESTFPYMSTSSVEALPPSWKEVQPMFRIQRGLAFLKTFESDRMHMFDTESNQWRQPPPSYDCIQRSSRLRSNLKKYTRMRVNSESGEAARTPDDNQYGLLVTMEQLRASFIS